MIPACCAVMLDAGLWIFIRLRRTGLKGFLFFHLFGIKYPVTSIVSQQATGL